MFKVYHQFHSIEKFLTDLNQPNSFLLYSTVLKNIQQMNITSEINRTQMIFQYDVLCSTSFLCFHDDVDLCLCTQYDRVECFRYKQQVDLCDQKPCLANGQCLHGDEHNRTDFVCLCPEY